jgi:hypothetical protein
MGKGQAESMKLLRTSSGMIFENDREKRATRSKKKEGDKQDEF